jgi:DNA-binding response OmpR family regulator
MDKSKANILYIEDYPVVQEMYHEALRARGFNVDTASDGKEALEKVANNKYEIILLDLLLPNVTGMEFLREFKAKGYTGEVIILSDFDNSSTVGEAGKLGVTNYWIKVNNTPHALADRLERVIGEIQDPLTPPPAQQ